jgi:hypothetical protein
MFDLTDLDSLIAYEDLQRAGYPLEAEDALAAWAQGEVYRPARYMELPDSIRYKIAMANWQTLRGDARDAHPDR